MSLDGYLDRVRREKGLLSIGEVAAISQSGNVIYDPWSVLISTRAIIGRGNTFFPGVYIFCIGAGTVEIGNDNCFHSNTLIEASTGAVRIGARNQFGEGGFTARANRRGASISIGDDGRYMNGAAVFGDTVLGSGSQLLGSITVDSCKLEAGGSYRERDPNRRAGLLKGTGVARNITVPIGQVIVGSGLFLAGDAQRQADLHRSA